MVASRPLGALRLARRFAAGALLLAACAVTAVSAVDKPGGASSKFTLRPGDVLANAPLGVARTPAPRSIEVPAWSPHLGVVRTPPPPPPAQVTGYSSALGVHRGPAVSDVVPERVSIGATAQVIEVLGSGLGNVTAVRIDPAASITIGTITPAADGTRVAVRLDVGADAAPGLRRLQLLTAAGQVVPELRAGAGRLLIAAATPVVESVTPNLFERGQRLQLTIRGQHLRGLPFGRNIVPEQPSVRLLPGDGITLGTDATSNDAGTVVTVSVDVAASAPLGARVVQVVTASGESAAEPAPANTVTVVDGPLRTLSPFVSPLVGVTRTAIVTSTRFAWSAAVGVVRGPVVLDFTPSFVSPGSTATLRLSGRELGAYTGILIEPDSGIATLPGSFNATADEVRVDVTIAADAPILPRRLRLTGPGAPLQAPKLLEVRAAPPVITALTPTFILRDGTNQTIAVQGENLAQTAAALIVPDTGFVIENWSVQSSTLGSVRLRAATDAALGPRVLRVSGSNGISTAEATPGNTLYVVDRPQLRTPYVGPLLGVVRESLPTQATRLAYAGGVGVVRGRHATGVVPASIERGRTTRITVNGYALGGVDGVTVESAEGVTVSGLTVAADGRSLAFDVSVAADVPASLRRIDLRAAGAVVPFVPATAALLAITEVQVVAPIASPDTYAVTANRTLNVDAAQGVLVNDTDPNGGTLYAVLRRLPARGALNLRGDGGFTYEPDPDFVGTDRFEYSAGAGTVVGTATFVTLNVRERNDAVDDQYTTTDSGTLTVPAASGLLANDVIAAGANVAIVLSSQPTRGQLSLQPDGGFTYQPNGTAGTDQFRYRLVEDGVQSLPATVTITITAVNDPPVAEDDRWSVNRGSTLTVPPPGVLANDSDPDDPQSSLSVRVITPPQQGGLVLNTNGGFTYTPPPDYLGLVSFVYEVRDPGGLTDTATVIIDVNDGLSPAPDAYSVNEGEVLFVAAPGILGNDSVVATGPVRIELVQAPTPELGTVVLANDGSFVFRPNTPDVNGVTTFRYRLRDNVTQSAPANVRITIVAVNDPPVTANDHWLSDENAELIVPAPGVLANDRDIDSPSLRAQILVPPTRGTLTLRADGSFNYVPEVNWRGVDTFTYSADDTQGGTTPGVVTIDVTQPPTATNDVYLVDVDTTLTVSDVRQGLLVNDHDAPENDPLTVVPNTPPRHGTLALTANGTFTYTPATGYTGLDTFQYQVTDGRSLSNLATVTLAVGITSLPRANPDAYATNEDVELVVPAAQGVLINDTDADTPREQLEAGLVDYDDRNIASIQLAANGSFRLRPATNFSGRTFFAYQVYDGTSISNTAIVEITVNAVNDGVEANDDRFGVLRNTIFVSTWPNVIDRNDRWDPDYPIRWELVTPPQFGTAEINPTTAQLRYTPAQNFAGLDTLTYRLVQTTTGLSDTAVVTLRTNGPPIAGPDAYTAPEDASTVVTPSLLANDSDPDGDPIRLDRNTFADGNGWYAVTSNDLSNPTETRVVAGNNFYGVGELRYRILDGTTDAYGTIRVTITPVPDDPRAAGDSYLVRQNTPLVVNSVTAGVLGNDFDPDTRPGAGSQPWPAASGVDLEPLRAILVSSVAVGTLNFNDNGTFTFVPPNGYSGTTTFRYRAVDGTGRSSETVTVSIRVNSPAIARDDAYVTQEDVLLSVPPAQGVLVNDTDPDGDALIASFASNGCAPCNGRVVLASNGSFRYTPNRDFHGSDEFYYRASDGVDGSSLARVAITVLPVNDPPRTEPDTYRTPEDVVLVAPQAQGVLRNDREVDGEALTGAVVATPPTLGTVLLGTDGRFTYTPDVNRNGRDTFRYRVYDESGLWSEESVEVFITPVNDPPVARNDTYETRKDTVLDVPAALGVLANDSDVDGPALTAAVTGPPQHGELTLAADGSFRYVPNGVYVGIDQFQYQVDDGLGALASASVSINVRDLPGTITITAEDDFYRFDAPGTTISPPGVLANDRVVGAAALTATLIVPPQHGIVTLRADGGFTYTANPGHSGIDGFTYAARAGDVSELARVTLDVVPVGNLPPIALGEQFGVIEDGVLDSRSVGTLLVNDRDPENAPLRYVGGAPPAHGVLVAAEDGHFTYTPAPDYHGSDAFTYRVTDGSLQSGEVTAAITVFAQNDAPQARADSYQGVRNQALSVPASSGLLANDIDVDGDALVVALVDTPLYGQVQVEPDGAFAYSPSPGWVGTDRFRYAASDGSDRGLAEVTIRINPPGNRPPVAVGENWTFDEDQVLSSDTVGLLTANDSDPDGDPLTVILVSAPAHGTLTLNGAAFTYVPAANFAGTDAFTYRVSDGALQSEVVTAALTIRAVDDPPIVVDDLYTTPRTQPLVVPAASGVLANDSDVEGAVLVASVTIPPGHGTLKLLANGAFTYQPNGAFVGRDEFSYAASDGVNSTTGRVRIDITASGNRRPIAQGEQFVIPEDSVLDTRQIESLLANDYDPDGQSLSLVVLGTPPHGTLETLPGGHVRYVPGRDATGEVRIPYTVSDGELEAVPVLLSILLTPQPDAPVAQPDLYRIAPGTTNFVVPVANGVLANDRDPDGDTLTATLLTPPSAGALNLGLDGSFVYTVPLPTPTQTTFRYRAADASGRSADAEVTLLMNAVPAPDPIFRSGFEDPTP